MQMYRQGGNQQQPATGRVIEGLSLFAFPSSSASSSFHLGSPSAGASNRAPRMNDGVAAAMHLARNAPHSTSGGTHQMFSQRLPTNVPLPNARATPRFWKQISELNGFAIFVVAGAGSSIPQAVFNCMPDTMMLGRIVTIFGMRPGQVGLAYDPSGRCVCEERLFLDLSHGLRVARLSTNVGTPWQSAAIFWTSELAHAIAHVSGGMAHGSGIHQLQSEIIASYLPLVLNSEFSAQSAQAGYWRT